MLFNTWVFCLFFVIVFCVYHSLEFRAQNVFLLIASYFFFGWWDWRFLSLLLCSTLIGYSIGLRIHQAEGAHRKRWLVIGLCVDLTILGFEYRG